jgi:hypothetical protein
MTITMISELLTHGARIFVLLDQVDMVENALLMMMNDEDFNKKRGCLGSIGI